jgi:DHA2 family multidrug resistance protein-like MFS transporter
MATGLALAAIAFATLVRVDERSTTLVVALAFAVFCFGVTPTFALATDMIVGASPPERAGVASGISETGAELGGAVGIAAFGSIGIAVYRSELGDAIPAGVPAGDAEVARDTLGGAHEVSAELPTQVGSALLDAARDAFTSGLQVTAVTGAVLLAVLAVVVAIALRGVKPAPGPEAHIEPGGAPVPVS